MNYKEYQIALYEAEYDPTEQQWEVDYYDESTDPVGVPEVYCMHCNKALDYVPTYDSSDIFTIEGLT